MNEDQIKTKTQMRDPIERQAAIDLVKDVCDTIMDECDSHYDHEIGDEVYNDILEVDAILKCNKEIRIALASLPSAQPEQRYTEEELRVFQHGISLRLLSKRSAQHWRYDKDTATEIEFLERLYDKVVADMRGEQDEC